MGDTLSVFKRKSKPKFNIPKEEKPKIQRVRVTAKRRNTEKSPRKKSDAHRPKRTLYENTINVDRSGRIAPEEYKTASIDAIRAHNKRKYVAWGVFFAVMVTALVALVVWFGVLFFFKINVIQCEGITVYDTADIIEASGLTVGGKMYGIDGDEIAKRLGERYPYLMNIKVERRLPDKVVIIAEEDTAVYYMDLGGKYYLLSEELRVLESSASEGILVENEDLLHIILPGISRAVVGEQVQYFREKNDAYVRETLATITDLEDVDRISVVDMSDRFELKFTYDDRIEVELGSATDIPAKVRFAIAMIGEFSEFATGTVSARSVESGYANVKDPQSVPETE